MNSLFLVLARYGNDWEVVAECSNITDAVNAREQELRSHGGDVRIFEQIETLQAYAAAAAWLMNPSAPGCHDNAQS